MIQQSTAIAFQSGLQSYGKSAAQESSSSSRTKSSSQQQSEQTGQSSPDVVTSFSEAGLEAARSLTQPQEVTSQARTEERRGESELRESSVKQQQEMNSQSEQRSSGPINLLA